MKNWKQYQQAEPILLRIEQRFARLQSFERRYPANQTHLHGFFLLRTSPTPERHWSKVSKAKQHPFLAKYITGCTHFTVAISYRLVAALGSSGMMDRQKDDPESRNAFYQFFRTVPLNIRLGLGQKLNHPELTEQALRIQAKIKAKKALVKSHLDKNFSN